MHAVVELTKDSLVQRHLLSLGAQLPKSALTRQSEAQLAWAETATAANATARIEVEKRIVGYVMWVVVRRRIKIVVRRRRVKEEERSVKLNGMKELEM